MQGETKRKGYFPKGLWYNLFDNTTVDAHDGGKSVMLDLPMGHVGVHMMGGTVLPMQQPALVTADVRASPLTLVIALPHMDPLLHFAHAANLQATGESSSARWTVPVSQQHSQLQASQSRKMMASMQAQLNMTPGMQAKVAAGTRECGVSEPGRVTACGQVFMDNNDDALEVSPAKVHSRKVPLTRVPSSMVLRQALYGADVLFCVLISDYDKVMCICAGTRVYKQRVTFACRSAARRSNWCLEGRACWVHRSYRRHGSRCDAGWLCLWSKLC